MAHPANSLAVIPIHAKRMEFARFKMAHSNASVLQDILGSYVSCHVLPVSLILYQSIAISCWAGGCSLSDLLHVSLFSLITVNNNSIQLSKT